MISLSMHMIRSQGRISVQCVTNGLQGKTRSMNTKYSTVERDYLHVLIVRNVLQLGVTWFNISLFTPVNTSAMNVERVVEANMI